MAVKAPPEPPLMISVADDDGMARLRLRLHLMALATITILANAWLFTLDLGLGCVGLLVSKHVLVALLVLALGVDARPVPTDE